MDLSPSTSNTSKECSNDQPINAGSLKAFHNTMQKFAFNLNPKIKSKQHLPTTLTLPTFLLSPSLSLSLSHSSPISAIQTKARKNKKRPAPTGIPKYNQSPTKKRKKNNKHITHMINDINHKNYARLYQIPSSITNTPSIIQYIPNTNTNTNTNTNRKQVINQMKINNNCIHIQTSKKITKKDEQTNEIEILNPAAVYNNNNNNNNNTNNNKKKLNNGKNKKLNDDNNKKAKACDKKNKMQLQTVDGNGYLTRSKRKELERKNKHNKLVKLPSIPLQLTLKRKKKKTRKTKTKRKTKRKSTIIDGYLSTLSSTTLQCLDAEKKQKCMSWMNIDIDIDNKFTDTTRLDRNCISNYVINKKDINTKWLKQDEDINIRFSMSYNKNNYNYGESDEDYICLHCINLNREYISLECPYCGIYLQCISLGDYRIGFMCYNYPRCEYPLNCCDYQCKYIWNNVRYIGPQSSFGENGEQLKQWNREQDRLNKKLTERIHWKKLIRKSRHKQLNKLYNTLERFKSYNIKTNKQVIYHVFNKKMDKINRLRHKNMIKFKRIVANEEDRPLRHVQEYEIKRIINACKVVLVPYPSKKRIYNYKTRSQSQSQTIINKKKYAYHDHDDTNSDSDSDSDSDPEYKPSISPIPFIDNDNESDHEDDDLMEYKKKACEITLTNIDKLIFIDLYKATKMKSNYNIKWLFDKTREISKRYENLQFQVFNKCMKQLLKPKAEMELIENLALQSMPVLPPDQLPFDDTLQTKKKGKKMMNHKAKKVIMKKEKKEKKEKTEKKKKKEKQQLLDLKELPIFELDLNAFAKQFKLT